MKTDRLLAIVMLLLSRKRVNATELAERFEISLRTVYRDLDTIGQAGIPIVSHAGAAGGYEIMEQFRIDRQMLTLEELMSIVSGLRGVQTGLGDPQLEGLLDKVGALIARGSAASGQAEENLLIDLNPFGTNNDMKSMLAQIRSAIRSRQLIRLTYRNNKQELQERLVEPLVIALKGFTWYLYGYCRLRSDFRTFRISRIRGLEQLEEHFPYREHSLSELQYPWQQKPETESTCDRIQITLRIDPSIRVYAEDMFGPDTVTEQKDGTLHVQAQWYDEPWLKFQLLAFGSRAQILAPSELAEKVAAEARKVAALYDSASLKL
ncbi:helix-turn-helix transcriptional regulator [Paenibacillus shenyangensis]|uniref:helix-turn-helix transcriptional regulator n=1 Tax=Paenibacillus sp. A9 TaxID=1284352 RepID=UPI00037325A9|nr:YafY family protein [Paenibacillus sp. A9]